MSSLISQKRFNVIINKIKQLQDLTESYKEIEAKINKRIVNKFGS